MGDIHVTYLDCSKSDKTASTIAIVFDATSGKRVTLAKYTVARTALGADIHLGLSPGFYHVIIANGSCQDDALVPVLSRNQAIFLIGRNGFTLRESAAMVAGSLPFSGYTASIVYYPQDQVTGGPKSLVEDPARVDGDSYYATGLPQGVARLRIRTADGSHFLEFPIGLISGDRTHRDVVFNLTSDEVRNAVQHAAF